MKLIFYIMLLVFFSQSSGKNISSVLMSLDDNSQVLAHFENENEIAGIGRRQDNDEEYDNYYNDDDDGDDDDHNDVEYDIEYNLEHDEYYKEKECTTNFECGFFAFCIKRLGVCVCRKGAFGKYPQCCRQDCTSKGNGTCDAESRRCACKNEELNWSEGCSGTLILSQGGVSYFRVPSTGLTDAELVATCRAAGLNAWCHGPAGCQYNSGECKVTSLSTLCGSPGRSISQQVCGGNTLPYNCRQTQNLNTYMNNWNGVASYGITTNNWGILGRAGVAGDVLCVS